ncbi:MAG: ATP-binding cassette domain-containing protein, partial [Bdellovibrionota bacterium]|nr:ATP-binding cassette domain-containing protein [Bdellovibrionota bacterium]
STLLKLISRITYPTCGKISYKGSLTPMLEVGTGFHPELSGRENITLNATIHGMKLKEIEPLMGQILEFSEIGRQIDSPIKRYSSGMVVKLGFAIASYIKTDILLLDETLSVGDHAFKKKCILALKDLVKKEERSILIVSHDMDMVREICDEVCVMKQGRLSAPMEVETGISKYIKDEDIEAWSF